MFMIIRFALACALQVGLLQINLQVSLCLGLLKGFAACSWGLLQGGLIGGLNEVPYGEKLSLSSAQKHPQSYAVAEKKLCSAVAAT